MRLNNLLMNYEKTENKVQVQLSFSVWFESLMLKYKSEIL